MISEAVIRVNLRKSKARKKNFRKKARLFKPDKFIFNL